MTENTENKPNKYSTRGKVIDFRKIGEKLSLTGSICHYCKSIMCVQESNACRNTEKTNFPKKKNCNKKFCYDCLQKNFPQYWETRTSKDWRCPCCSKDCPCTQCKKSWIKTKPKIEEDVLLSRELTLYEIENSSSIMEKDEIYFKNEENNWTMNMMGNIKNNIVEPFDIDRIPLLLQSTKVSIDKFQPIPRPKIEIITENDFLNLKRAKDDLLETLEKYKDKLSFMKTTNII